MHLRQSSLPSSRYRTLVTEPRSRSYQVPIITSFGMVPYAVILMRYLWAEC